jgi:hypothetical protein
VTSPSDDTSDPRTAQPSGFRAAGVRLALVGAVVAFAARALAPEGVSPRPESMSAKPQRAPNAPSVAAATPRPAGAAAREAVAKAEAAAEAEAGAAAEAAAAATSGEGSAIATVALRPPFVPRPLPEKTARFANHWAYQPMAHPRPPQVLLEEWPRNEVDRFILATLEDQGLVPAREADRRTLLRRAYLDLIGIPPTADEVEAFESDTAPDAYERRIDALLANPMYGERWGRHWLDVARYADSNGVDENIAYANAYRYRDYVIDAFNRDLPFDEFLTEQIAGDLLPEPENPTADDDARTRGRLAALGFLALGPKMLAEPDKEKERVDVVDEQIDVVTKAFLGQTISCARCHDHKFDPISQADYFAIAGIFRSVSTFDSIATVGRVAQRPLATAAEIARHERAVKDWTDRAHELDRARDDARRTARFADGFAWIERSAALAGAPADVAAREQFRAAARSERPAHRAFLAAVDARKEHDPKRPAGLPRTLVVKEAKVDETPIHDRGDHMQPTGEKVARAMPAMLERVLPSPEFPADRSGRLEFALWMTDGENPLTARVAVNRLWTWHFGTGLVDTPSNFGLLGSKPSHPELLDFLARRFVADGFSMKAMHRLIMTSATYRQSSSTHVPLPQFDPDNRLISRFPRRRIEAEAIRDSVLAVAGTLDASMGGTLLGSGDHDYVTNDQSGNAARYDTLRRSVYLPVIRNAMFGLFSAFDYPDSSAPIDCRTRTVVAPQALFFLNAPFVEDAAKSMAIELTAEESGADARIREAFRRALAREPEPDEREESRGFLAELERGGMSAEDALVRLCHALLSTNEFVTME